MTTKKGGRVKENDEKARRKKRCSRGNEKGKTEERNGGLKKEWLRKLYGGPRN